MSTLETQPDHLSRNVFLRKRRRELGLSQQDLGERVGVTHSLISHFETQRNLPAMETAKKIAVVLGVEVTELFPEWMDLVTKDRRELETEQPEEISIDLVEANHVRQARDEYLIGQARLGILKERLREAGRGLKRRERQVLALLYRVSLTDSEDDDKESEDGPLTLKKLSEKYGISLERIRQIKERALRGLRRWDSREKDLRDLDGYDTAGSSKTLEALRNGIINALVAGDWERVETNLEKIEAGALSVVSPKVRVLAEDILKEPSYQPAGESFLYIKNVYAVKCRSKFMSACDSSYWSYERLIEKTAKAIDFIEKLRSFRRQVEDRREEKKPLKVPSWLTDGRIQIQV